MNQKLKAIVDPSPRSISEIFSPAVWKELNKLVDVCISRDKPLSAEELRPLRNEINIFIAGNWRYGELADYPRLRAFLEVSGKHPSAEEFDYKHAFSRSIRVLSCAPAFAPQVSEMALAMAINAAREISAGDIAFKNGSEEYLWDGNKTTFTLFGKCVGFVGYGNLARQLQQLIAPYHCRLQAYDPWLPEGLMERNGVEPVSLEQLMSTSDYVFVLAIVSKENKHLIDRRLLRLMKPGAVFALFSRAHVVDFDALCEILHSGAIRAAIDVFPEEPMPQNHPIRSAPNTVLSAHRAGSVAEDLRLIGEMVLEDTEAIVRGIPPRRMQNAEPELVGRL